MSKIKYPLFATVIILLVMITGCKKYLDAKPNKALAVITSLRDIQALLDYYVVMNQGKDAGGSGEVSADDYYLLSLPSQDFTTLAAGYKNQYTWEKDHLFDELLIDDWTTVHQILKVANTVLDNIGNVEITANNANDWNNAKGQAFFYRAKSFLQVALQWAPAYDKTTAATDLGIPLRLTSDFNIPSVRSTVQETYDRIIADFKEAISLLPINQVKVTRPTKTATYAFLARTYLAMREYDSCFRYATLAFQLNNTLVDYNTIDSNVLKGLVPFQQFFPEVLFESSMFTPAPLVNSKAKIDSFLRQSYSANDWRKFAFINAAFGFKGSYTNTGLFGGIATDEVYLMRAECYARQGDATAAMKDLNDLLRKRWRTSTYVDQTASSPADALNKILVERRKELLMRGLRWMDLKRLNKDGANITLRRLMNGQSYTLPPNDLRYALAIPEDVILLTGMPQNPR
jgi:tetratricopeptide (TPR) repeat protein